MWYWLGKSWIMLQGEQKTLSQYRVAMIGSRGVPANYSGVETYVEEVGAYLAQQGVKVNVYCQTKYVPKQSHYRGMTLIHLPTIATKHLETIIHTALSTVHALLQGDDIFHYQAMGPSTLAWIPRLFGRKVVTTIQGLDWNRAKWGLLARWYLRFAEWASVKFSHRAIAVSKTLTKFYLNHYQQAVVYIPNGCSPATYKPPQKIKEFNLDCENYILFVGRLSPEKGCHTLIQAYKQTDTDCHLVLAGRATFDDTYFQTLKASATDCKKIHFVGFVQDCLLEELYSNAYLVVHPSECEGLSISLMEAQSYNNCVLVSNIPENIEILPEEGYIFQVGDSQDLAKKLQALLDNPQCVQASKNREKHKAQNFWHWDKVGQETLRVYQSLTLSK